jgi:hypothetical protein
MNSRRRVNSTVGQLVEWLKMKRTLFYILALSLMLHAETGIVRAQNVILEAYMHDSEMPRREQHLYMRVLADGQVEYEDVIINEEARNNFGRPSKPKFVLRRTKMSKSEVMSLWEFLNSPVVRKMDTFYNFALTIDSYIFLNISISRPEHVQRMEVVNFNPTPKADPRANERLQPLLGLMCRIQRLRGNAKASVVYSDNQRWCPR